MLEKCWLNLLADTPLFARVCLSQNKMQFGMRIAFFII